MRSPRQQLVTARSKNGAAARATIEARSYTLAAVQNAALAGIPKTEIAELAGISRQTVYDILEEQS